MKKKVFSVLSLLLVFMMCFTTGCSSKSSEGNSTSNESAKTKKDIVIADGAEFTTMDPGDTNDTLSYSVQKTMMEGLFGFDKDMKVVPLLAESFTANDQATEFTIKLKKGIKFQDGTDFNADAVKINLDRLSDQTQGLKRNTLFKVIDKTEVVDDSTVKLILKSPFGAMINTLAHPAGMMISPKALKEYGKEVARHPVGTGPYKLQDWTPGTGLKVVKNDNYWNGKPQYDSITFKAVVEEGSRVAMLQTGEADFIFPVPVTQIDKIKSDKNITLQAIDSMVVRTISLNCHKKPFNDVRVRQALNYAIDKDAFAKVVYNGFAKPADSVIAPNVQFHVASPVYKADVEKAKSLLKEAGYPNGFKTTLWCSNSTAAVKAGEFIQQQLAQVGVDCKVVPTEYATLDQKVFDVQKGQEGEVEMYYSGWSPSTGDADWGIRPLYAGESFPPASFNTSYYQTDECDKAIQDALATTDPEKRAAAYKTAQEILWKDCPSVFLTVDTTTSAIRNTASNLMILPDGSLAITTPSK